MSDYGEVARREEERDRYNAIMEAHANREERRRADHNGFLKLHGSRVRHRSVGEVAIFGSARSGKQRPDSDVDVLVGPLPYFGEFEDVLEASDHYPALVHAAYGTYTTTFREVATLPIDGGRQELGRLRGNGIDLFIPVLVGNWSEVSSGFITLVRFNRSGLPTVLRSDDYTPPFDWTIAAALAELHVEGTGEPVPEHLIQHYMVCLCGHSGFYHRYFTIKSRLAPMGRCTLCPIEQCATFRGSLAPTV